MRNILFLEYTRGNVVKSKVRSRWPTDAVKGSEQSSNDALRQKTRTLVAKVDILLSLDCGQLRQGVRDFQKVRWEDNWTANAAPLFV